MTTLEETGLGVTIPEFVIQEAKEKCFEIEVKALKQFEKEKRAYLDIEEEKVNKQFSDLARKQEMDFKIRRSAAINKARLSKMQARDKAMMKIFSDCQYSIFERIKKDQGFYKKLLKNLILQGLVQMFEKNIKIKCLQRDAQIIKSIIPEAITEFKAIVKRDLDLDYECNVTVDEGSWLEERNLTNNFSVKVADYSKEQGLSDILPKNEDDKKCFGGVVLTNTEGNILCKNTLDGRIDLCYQECLPDLRQILFPRK